MWGRTIPWNGIRIAMFYLGLLGLWQVVTSTGTVPERALPGPMDVWNALRLNAQSGDLLRAVLNTLLRMAMGYSLSIGIGIALGIAMGVSKVVDETVGSLVLGLQSLPSVTWFPLAVAWFGVNTRAVVFVVLMGSVWSVAIAARTGVRGIPPVLMRASWMFGGRRLQRIALVIVPGMAPSLIQGLKLGWSFAWRSLLAAELLFESVSLGHLLQQGRVNDDISQVVAIMFVIVAIGMAVDRLIFGRAERWVADRWGTG